MAPTKHEHAHGAAGSAVADPRAAVPASEEPRDPRVAAVLEVLGGTPLQDAATHWAVDPDLLQRWVTAFVSAGTAQVLNRPDAEARAHRDRFLAAFTFEIRSPLTVAMGWAGLLAEGDLPPVSFLRTARRLQDALALLADRLFDVELLVAAALGGLRLERQSVTAAEVCRLPEMEVIGGDGPTSELYVDPPLFSRILSDLWRAAEHPPAPRALRIETHVVEPWVEVRIVRDGDPIDTDILQALFEPFGREQLSPGMSIGLYLARALTVAHGGSLGMEQGDHQAVLWVRVPLTPDNTEPATAHDSGGSR